MVDLHTHILSGLDDGADNGTMSAMMAQIAFENGTNTLVATPHIKETARVPSWEEIVDGCSHLQMPMSQGKNNLRILPGAEVELSLGILNRLKGRGPYCINGGRYLLVELPAVGIPLYVDEFFFVLQIRGVNPILAHPERHPVLRNDFSILKSWIDRGILVQINGPSLTGYFGSKAQKAAESLLKQGMVHCIGSDAHNNSYRSPDLAAVQTRIQKLVGLQKARRILVDNPVWIVDSLESESVMS